MFRRRGKFSQKTKNKDSRLTFLGVVLFLFGFLIGFRLFNIQILEYSFYKALASGQHEIYQKLFPERGEIFLKTSSSYQDYLEDTDNSSSLYTLATNRDFDLVYVEPRNIDEPAVVAEKLSSILEITQEELFQKLSQEDDPYEVLKHKISKEEKSQIQSLNLDGIAFAKEIFRFWPEANLASHILGFVGFSGQERLGQYGLEGHFEELLKGKQGFIKSERDAAGRFIGVAPRDFQEAEDGADLILTLDQTIQFVVCDELEKAVLRHGAQGGTVIVMEPTTGAILAMCSTPSFNPNNYQKVEDINIFNNPAIFATYEPGSIFKPITMAAAIDAQKITPDTYYEDKGFIKIGGYTIKNSGNKVYGKKSMAEVLEESINTGAIFVVRQLGDDLFLKYIEGFGFGERTGIELDTEMPGDISSLKEKKDIYSATASFGQGITVTPIQMVAAYGAMANGGNLMKPYIVEEIVKNGSPRIKTQPHEIRKIISSKTATLLSGMLVSVVENGHGRRAGVPGYLVAGKTGTAQVAKKESIGYDPTLTIGSFVGFAPADDPRFVMLVKIDNPQDVIWAESSAAPLFGKLARFMLQYYEIPPEREVK